MQKNHEVTENVQTRQNFALRGWWLAKPCREFGTQVLVFPILFSQDMTAMNKVMITIKLKESLLTYLPCSEIIIFFIILFPFRLFMHKFPLSLAQFPWPVYVAVQASTCNGNEP